MTAGASFLIRESVLCRFRAAIRRAVYALIGAAWLMTAASVSADEIQDFERARDAYLENDYAAAVQRFEDLVGGDTPRLRSRPLVLESRKYLAASHLFQGDREKAEKQFELLLREEPSYQIDPVSFPAAVQKVFSAVQERLAEERAREEVARRQREEEARRKEVLRRERDAQRLTRLRELAATEVVTRENSRWVAFIPFGVGQFQNDHDTLGWVIAVSSALLAAVSVGSFLVHQGVNPRNTAEAGLEQTARITNQASTIALAVLGVAGVIDANLRFVPTVVQTRPRPLPPDLLHSEPATGSALSGLTLTVSF